MPSQDYDIDIMIPESEITAKVNAMSRDISKYYAKSGKLVVVGLLRGSFMFVADLVRRLDLPVEVDFMTVSSYGSSMRSSREVRILKDLDGDIENVDVLVAEDIIDTGYSLSQVLKIFSTRKPQSLEVCCLLNKPSRREVVSLLNGWGLISLMNLLLATVLIMPRTTATCPISARCG